MDNMIIMNYVSNYINNRSGYREKNTYSNQTGMEVTTF